MRQRQQQQKMHPLYKYIRTIDVDDDKFLLGTRFCQCEFSMRIFVVSFYYFMNDCNGQRVNTFVQQQKIEIKSIEDSLMCSGKAGASLPCIFFVLHLCYHEHEK